MSISPSQNRNHQDQQEQTQVQVQDYSAVIHVTEKLLRISLLKSVHNLKQIAQSYIKTKHSPKLLEQQGQFICLFNTTKHLDGR